MFFHEKRFRKNQKKSKKISSAHWLSDKSIFIMFSGTIEKLRNYEKWEKISQMAT